MLQDRFQHKKNSDLTKGASVNIVKLSIGKIQSLGFY